MNPVLALSIEATTGFIKTLACVTIVGALGTELIGEEQSVINILGVGYPTIMVMITLRNVRRKILFLKALKQMAESMKNLEEVNKGLSKLNKDKDKQ